jgi:histidinol phosphatase-like PHP family hydrolase
MNSADKIAFTNYHCHTNVDFVCEPDLTPEVYAALLQPPLRRAVLTDHGFMLYFGTRELVFGATWMEDPSVFDAHRERGNARVREAIRKVRDLKHPDVFVGIETDLMRDGRLTHDPVFTDEFDVIIVSDHFIPWLSPARQGETAFLRGWLDRVASMVARPEVDILGHPCRWPSSELKKPLPDYVIAEVVEMAAESRIALELNSSWNSPEENARMIRLAVDRGVPVVFGTDAHGKKRASEFDFHLQVLGMNGMTPSDLRMPSVEDFARRKGRRNDIRSRPAP